jgi:esterase/lipase superfamily enzyme
MKWFAISNRRKKGNRFGNEPESYGKLHWLSKTAGLPSSDKKLSLDYIGDSDDATATATFVKDVQNELRTRAKWMSNQGIDGKPTLLIYTHGYNNDWNDAREEYAQLRRNCQTYIGPDFEHYCLPILYSWPSAGKTLAYLEDRDDGRASSIAVKNMVHILYEATRNLSECISNVSVVAHSMGNYVFREALTSLAGSPQSPAGTFVDQFVSFGADIGNTSLEPGGKGYGIPRFCNRVSAYFSPADSILGKSKRKNGRPRLGRTLSSNYPQTPDSVVFIDSRYWANEDKLEELFGNKAPSVHSCFRSVPALLEDMFEVLKGVDRDIITRRKRIVLNKHYVMTE